MWGVRPARRAAVAGSCLLILGSALGIAGCGGGGGSGNKAPVAQAGADRTVHKHDAVTLDGSASTDPEGDALSFQWTQTAGTPVALSDTTAREPAFTALATGGTLVFELVVNDGTSASAADTVTITVENRAPVPLAGDNEMVGTSYVVTLDGSGSTDPDDDALTLTWVQKSGPAVALSANPNGSVSFTTPNSEAILEFTLYASDGETTTSDDIVVVTRSASSGGNSAPLADAGYDQVTARRSWVMLEGSGYDPDYDPVTYLWQQTAGPSVTLSDPTDPYPSFEAPTTAGDLVFSLTVSDGQLMSVADTVTITVRNFAPLITGVSLAPQTPHAQDNLVATVSAEDADQDPVTITYKWQRNGADIPGQTGTMLPETEFVKNDSITLVVTASDGQETATDQASVVIADSPAVLTGSAPITIEHGQLFTFQVSASDPDGDPVDDLVIDYGPSGMTIDGSGTVSWLVTDPMFDRAMDFHWRVAIAGQPTAFLEGTVTVTDANRQYPLKRTGVQIPLYHSGLVVANLDGDGDDDILVASGGTLYELSKTDSGYAQTWVYPFATSLSAVTAADDDGDDKYEIYYASGHTIVRLDGVNRRETTRATISEYESCHDLETGDLDGDGHLELVCLTGDNFYGSTAELLVFDAASLAPVWESGALNLGATMAVGNVDGDPALEIVTSGGFVYDGATFANQWTYGPGFGTYVDTGDLDGNGIEEIVGVEDWSAFRGFDAVAKSPVWEHDGFDFDAVWVGNIDADPVAEILIGDGQWGNVTAYKYVSATNSLQQVWQINSQNHGVTSIAVGDVDGDGAREFVWGSGATSSGEDSFVIAGLDPGIQVEWTNVNPNDLDGAFFGAQLARIGGGSRRVMFETPSSNSGYDGTRLLALDYSTGLLSVSSEVGSNWAGVAGLDVADYDQDGIDEMLLATANLYDGYFTAYDFAANTAEWTSPLDIGSGRSVVHGDMNDDGYDDMVVMTYDGHIQIYDLHNQALLWNSAGSNGGGSDVAVGDLDGDGVLEVIATIGEQLIVYQKTAGPVGYLEARSVTLSSPRDVEVTDTDGDGQLEIVVLAGYPGTQADVVWLDTSLNLLSSFDLPQTVYSLAIEDLGNARHNLVLSVTDGSPYGYPADPAYLLAVDARTGATVWRSPDFGTSQVNLNSLHYFDADEDGDREVAFGTWQGMFVTR